MHSHIVTHVINDSLIRFIAIRGFSLDEDLYIYEPLVGDRAAFRLKGLIIPKNKDDNIVGLGRISTVMGEIKDDDYEASLPIYSKAKAIEYERALLDLPTRLMTENKDLKNQWSGKLPSKRVIDIKHEATTASYEPIPFNQQLLIDGFICSSKYYDKVNGKCNFDRIEAMKKDIEKRDVTKNEAEPTVANEISAPNLLSTTPESKVDHTASDQESKTNECPVCKYMKGCFSISHPLTQAIYSTYSITGGPCKSEFIPWDNCIQELKEDSDLNVCFPHTVKLMECMRKEEYYDIMNVGNDYTHAAAQEEAQKEAKDEAKEQ